MRKSDTNKLGREQKIDGVPRPPAKGRKSEPVRLGTLLPAVMQDIKKRIERNGGFVK